MRFLLRVTFWLTLVCILLPRSGSQPAPGGQVSATDAMSAATATVGDMRQFCERQPGACNVGSQAAAELEDRAKAGARRLYQMLNEKLLAPENATAPTATQTESIKDIPLPPTRPSQRAAHGPLPTPTTSRSQATPQGTLTPADLVPIWRGPAPRKDAPGPA
jgi:hypothetical protein